MDQFWIGFLAGSIFGTSLACLVHVAIVWGVARFLIGRVPQ